VNANSLFLKTYNRMEVDKVYRLKRGNQAQTVGLIIKGETASVQVLGSQAKPSQLTDMEDCTDGAVLDNGSWSFSMLPEYVYFSGTADSIEIIGMSVEDLKITF